VLKLDGTAKRVRGGRQRHADIFKVDAAQLAGGAVEPDESLDLGTRITVARSERERNQRPGGIAPHLGRVAHTMAGGESGRKEHGFVRRVELFGAVIAMLEIAVAFESLRCGSHEGSLARAPAQRGVRVVDDAVDAKLALKAERGGCHEALIARERTRFERGADFGPRGPGACRRTLGLVRARRRADDVHRAQRDALRRHDDVHCLTDVGRNHDGIGGDRREADPADQ